MFVCVLLFRTLNCMAALENPFALRPDLTIEVAHLNGAQSNTVLMLQFDVFC